MVRTKIPGKFLLLIPLILVACAPTRIVKPLAKGEQAVSANFGGPLLNFGGAPIPLPLTSLVYARGISAKTTGFASLHSTALLFGVFQTDLGICRQVYYHQSLKLGVSVNPVLNLALTRQDKIWYGKLWPEIDLNIYKEFGTKNMIYGGIASWFELNKIRPHHEIQQQFVFINPHLGYLFTPRKWSYGLEAKYLMGTIKNTPNVADYIGINHYGAVGIYLNIIKKF